MSIVIGGKYMMKKFTDDMPSEYINIVNKVGIVEDEQAINDGRRMFILRCNDRIYCLYEDELVPVDNKEIYKLLDGIKNIKLT